MREEKEAVGREKEVIWARRGDTERGDITPGLLELNGTSVSLDFDHFFGRSFLDVSCFLSSVCP